MKRNKILSLSDDVVDFLKFKNNASEYVENLIRREMNPSDIDLNDVTSELSAEDEKDLNNLAERKKRQEERKILIEAFKTLPDDVQDEIKKIPNWGSFWRHLGYPFYESKQKLTIEDVSQLQNVSQQTKNKVG